MRKRKNAAEVEASSDEQNEPSASADLDEPVATTPAQDESADVAGEPVESSQGKAFLVKSKGLSFWRCGRQFTREATKLTDADVNPDELARLLIDPSLIVELVDL